MDHNLTEIEQLTWDFIKCVRKTAPATGATIAQVLQIKKEDHPGAAVRYFIHCLRVKGYPICADRHGYFTAYDQEDLDKYRKALKARALSIEEAVRGLENAKPVLELKAQEQIWEL